MSKTTTSPIDILIDSLSREPGELIFCRLCQTPITQTSDKIHIGPSHQHRFTNPTGVLYRISCFRQAPGCSLHGIPTIEDSWFSGYFWQLATCTECQQHLGWYFQHSGEHYFFGLITERLNTYNA